MIALKAAELVESKLEFLTDLTGFTTRRHDTEAQTVSEIRNVVKAMQEVVDTGRRIAEAPTTSTYAHLRDRLRAQFTTLDGIVERLKA